jgi:peroxin-4
MARSRLVRELKEIQSMNDPSIKLSLTGESLSDWKCILIGPSDSPYKECFFELHIKCDSNYPLTPPKVKFITPIFHPNVHFTTGEICLDILKDEGWSPAWSLVSVCRAILLLMSAPNEDSPLNCDAGNLIRSGDKQGWLSLARYYAIENSLK